MADTFQKSAFIIGKLTIWKDGTIRSGMAQEGPDRTGIRVMASTLEEKDEATGKGWETTSTRRVGFHPNIALPIWWGGKHKRKLTRWMNDHAWEIQKAVNSMTHGNRIDVPEKVSTRAPLEIGKA